MPDGLEAGGVLFEALVFDPQLADDVLDVGLGGAQRRRQLGEGFVGRQLRDCEPEQVARTAASARLRDIRAGEGFVGAGYGLAHKADLGQQ